MNYTGDRTGGGGLDRNKHRENLDHRGYISEMREIITQGGKRTRLREIAEFSTKLLEAPAEIGRVYTSDEKGLLFPKKKNRVIVLVDTFLRQAQPNDGST